LGRVDHVPEAMAEPWEDHGCVRYLGAPSEKDILFPRPLRDTFAVREFMTRSKSCMRPAFASCDSQRVATNGGQEGHPLVRNRSYLT
jgi:hypothetical protein